MITVNALKSSAGVASAIASLVVAGAALAQSYPTQRVTMVVPFPPGGPSDVVARIMAEGMAKHLKQPVIVENVGGAGGTIGSARVATATPDGYTILAGAMGSFVAAPILTPNIKYDPVNDFQPIGLTAHAPVAIVARKTIPAQNMKEFVAYLKANGDKVTQAHGGIGAASHMACLLFTSQLGVKPSLVPYKGTGPAMNDVVAGQVDFFCDQVVSVAGQVQGQSVKAFGVSAPVRLASLPNVPTTREAGVPQYQMSIWSAVVAPKGTPAAAVKALSAALDRTLDDPETENRLAKLGGTIPTKGERGPDPLGKLMKAELQRWTPILQTASAAPAAK